MALKKNPKFQSAGPRYIYIYTYAVTRVKLSANLDKLKAGAFVIERDRLN